jgi:hypothetical protein
MTDWAKRARELLAIPKNRARELLAIYIVDGALQLGSEMADARAEEIAQAIESGEHGVTNNTAHAAVARSTIPKLPPGFTPLPKSEAFDQVEIDVEAAFDAAVDKEEAELIDRGREAASAIRADERRQCLGVLVEIANQLTAIPAMSQSRTIRDLIEYVEREVGHWREILAPKPKTREHEQFRKAEAFFRADEREKTCEAIGAAIDRWADQTSAPHIASAAADMARDYAKPAPKTREQVLEEALRVIQKQATPSVAIEAKCVVADCIEIARRALEYKPAPGREAGRTKEETQP